MRRNLSQSPHLKEQGLETARKDLFKEILLRPEAEGSCDRQLDYFQQLRIKRNK